MILLRTLLSLVVLAGCARSPGPLIVPSIPIGDAAWRATVEGATGASIVGSNSVQVLLDGNRISPAMVAAIEQAQTTITLVPFIWHEGPISRVFAEALAGDAEPA